MSFHVSPEQENKELTLDYRQKIISFEKDANYISLLTALTHNTI